MTRGGEESKTTVVISGAGIVTSLGLDRAQTWESLLQGRSGIGPLTALEQQPANPKGGGQAPELPEDYHADEPREARYLRYALEAALRDAGIDGPLPYAPRRCSMLMGTTLHGMRAAGRFLRENQPERLGAFLAPVTLDRAARELGIRGFAATTCSACSSGLAAIAGGVAMLRAGEADLVLAGGYDVISEYAYGGFESLRLVAQGPPRPFCRNREGMKVAEGFGVVVLERAEAVRRRGARPLATVLGCGESADAYHLTQPHPQGHGAALAITRALEDAGLQPDDIGLISAHATSTPDNDSGECAALRRAFGERLSHIPLVAFKSQLGHTLGGAGAVELVLTAMAMQQQVVPTTLNISADQLEHESLRLNDGPPAPPPAPIVRTASLSSGFGGANACVILGRADESDGVPTMTAALHVAPREAQVCITGVGTVFGGAVGNDAFVRRLGGDNGHPVHEDFPGVSDEQMAALITSRRVRRMSQYVKLTLSSAGIAWKDAGLDGDASAAECTAAILGSCHGSATYSVDYYRELVEKGISAGNPMLFAEGVPNAGAAHLSLMLGLRGGAQAIIGSRTAGLDALHLARLRIARGEIERIVVSAGEEYAPLVRHAYAHGGLYNATRGGTPYNGRHGFVFGEGAVTLVLESGAAARGRGVESYATVEQTAGGSVKAGDHRGMIALMDSVLAELGDVPYLIAGANGTWLDCVEARALRRRRVAVSSIYGYIGETFAASGLASIAAVLLTGTMPRLSGGGPGGRAMAADGRETPSAFGVLSADYRGPVAAARLTLGTRRAHLPGADQENS